MKVVRMYDHNGQSRFMDIDIALNPSPPFEGISGLRASAPFSPEQCFFFSCPPCVMAPHAAPRRQLGIILSGEMEIETGDGDARRFRPGDIFLADDTTGTGHISRVLSHLTVLYVPLASIPA
jgi:hypothetical protein